MKEFWIYTGLRFLLFAGAMALTLAVWAIFDSTIDFIPAALIAAVISSVASWKLLAGPRDRFARRVQDRADRATAAFEASKAKEDLD